MIEFPLPFAKMSGTGNDFIIIDNRRALVRKDEMAGLAVSACRRNISVGADGLILIKDDSEYDFAWDFFNSDGSVGEMCGNGSRCAARFTLMKGITGRSTTFRTLAGPISAEVNGSSVRVQMTRPFGLEGETALDLTGGNSLSAGFVNTGVPHAVVVVKKGELDGIPVAELGSEIRNHPRFAPAGTNANFVEVLDAETIRLRTYERGVEGETLACGTGAVASAIICAERGLVAPPVTVITRSSEKLEITFDPSDPMGSEVYMEGTALLVYEGQLTNETVTGG